MTDLVIIPTLFFGKLHCARFCFPLDTILVVQALHLKWWSCKQMDSWDSWTCAQRTGCYGSLEYMTVSLQQKHLSMWPMPL